MAIKEVVQKVSDVVSKKHLTFNADSQSLEVNKDFMADVIPVLKEEGIDVDQKTTGYFGKNSAYRNCRYCSGHW